jgi:RNA polymerase sigma factor (sigma-70 family)
MTPSETQETRQALRALAVDSQNDDAWRCLINVAFPIALATANRILRGALDLAKDSTWEAFARIARYGDFQLLALMEPAAFLRYLKQITRRTSYDLLRSLARRSSEMQFGLTLCEEGIRSNVPTPEQSLAANELHTEILNALDPDERRLLNLVIEGFTLDEIAERMEITYEAAGVRKHRIRQKIRNYLTARGL